MYIIITITAALCTLYIGEGDMDASLGHAAGLVDLAGDVVEKHLPIERPVLLDLQVVLEHLLGRVLADHLPHALPHQLVGVLDEERLAQHDALRAAAHLQGESPKIRAQPWLALLLLS